MKTRKLFCMGLLFLLAIGLTGCERESDEEKWEKTHTEWVPWSNSDKCYTGVVCSEVESPNDWMMVRLVEGDVSTVDVEEVIKSRNNRFYMQPAALSMKELKIGDIISFHILRHCSMKATWVAWDVPIVCDVTPCK